MSITIEKHKNTVKSSLRRNIPWFGISNLGITAEHNVHF